MQRLTDGDFEASLLDENVSLRIRLYEAEQALSAIRSGAVDALVLDGANTPQVFTLEGAETPYRSFVEQMQEGAVSMSLDGTILYANRRFAEIVDRPFESLVGSLFQHLATSSDAVNFLMVRGGLGVSRGELILRDGSPKGVPVFASIHRPSGDEPGLCMVVTELTEIVAARLLVGELEARVDERTAALVASNLELQGFSYSVSHDMRTPLRAIVGNAHIVIEDESENLSENGKLHLQSLSKAAMKMAQLVDDLLQFARLGGCLLSIEKTNLGQLAAKVAGEVAPLHPDCKLELTVDEDLWAECDARFLGMAIQNLFDNACKYRKTGLPARVRIGKEELLGQTIFFIQDEGIGFDMKYVDKLFMPFERLHRDAEYVGTGIGLANVKRAIERHGGKVWASGEPEMGTKFSFTLPNALVLDVEDGITLAVNHVAVPG